MNDIIELEPKSPLLLTTAQLIAALAAAKPGDVIVASPVTYTIKAPLLVPDGVTLDGGGTMRFDQKNGPTGVAGPNATLTAGPGLKGDLLTLGHGARVRNLVLRGDPAWQGNLVVVASRKPGDEVTAVIEECELHVVSIPGANRDGPTGRGVAIFTRNPKLAKPADPIHDGASLGVTVRRSIVHSTNRGHAVFAANFAPRAYIVVALVHNAMIDAGLDAVGGVSRPDAVTDSQVIIVSQSNVYRTTLKPNEIRGWTLHGGSNPPIDALVPPHTNGNTLLMDSTDDVIEGFNVGLYAVAGGRPFDLSNTGAAVGTVNDNSACLRLERTLFSQSRFADIILIGGQSGTEPGAVPRPPFVPGDRNRLYVTLRGVKATRARPDLATVDGTKTAGLNNVFENAAGFGGATLPVALRGVGNVLTITGDVPFNPGPPALVKLIKF